MAAIDIILEMSDGELIKYYKYCMVNRFRDIKFKNNGYYSESYNQNRVIIGIYPKQLFTLYYPNEIFLFNEMWDRYVNAPSFAKRCWWEAMRIFNTKVDMPYIEPKPEIQITENIVTETKVVDFIMYNSEKYVFIASGLKRKVYVSPDKTHVIKIPREDSYLGIEENNTEAKMYKENPNGNYAKCELIENGWLKMEFVKPAYFQKGDAYPSWTLDIAEHQVGYNNSGKLVAYDYGSEI